MTNAPKVIAAIVLFVAAFCWFASREARSDESELYFGGGSAMVRGYTPAVGMELRFPDAGPGTMDYVAGFILSGESEYRGTQPNTITAYGMLMPSYGQVDLGLGFALHNNEWSYSCQETFALAAGYRFKRWTARWMHFSSAGSCLPNSGRDFLNLYRRF